MDKNLIMINKVCHCCFSKNIFCCLELNSKHMLHCTNCGVYFFAETPTSAELTTYYRTNYSDVHQRQLFELLKKNYDSGFYKNEVINILNYYGKRDSDELKILDYGSGYGFFLSEAKKMDLIAYGVEYDEEVAKYNETEFGINMISNTQFETIEDESFDIIRANHSIEHLPDPHHTLSIFFKKLKKNGIILISSPCFSKHIVQSNSMKLYDMIYPEHLFYFTNKSIERLVENIGFKTELNITQFASPDLALRLLGINQDLENLYKISGFRDFQRLVELDPFFAGNNLFTVARKRSHINNLFIDKIENTQKSLNLIIHPLNEYEMTINGISESAVKKGMKSPNSRGFHFESGSENNTKFSILFPFKSRNFKKGKIYLSGTILTLNSQNTTISILDRDKKPLPNNSGLIRFNDMHNFVILNEYSGNDIPDVFYACIIGDGSEIITHDLICSEIELFE